MCKLISLEEIASDPDVGKKQIKLWKAEAKERYKSGKVRDLGLIAYTRMYIRYRYETLRKRRT